MRGIALIALVLFGTAPAFAAEEPSGCDKFKWPIDRERAALTAPDRAKLASGGEQAALPATGITLALVAPAANALLRFSTSSSDVTIRIGVSALATTPRTFEAAKLLSGSRTAILRSPSATSAASTPKQRVSSWATRS